MQVTSPDTYGRRLGQNEPHVPHIDPISEDLPVPTFELLHTKVFDAAMDRLRITCFPEELWAESARDEYNAHSTHIACRIDRELAGYVRLTPGKHGYFRTKFGSAIILPNAAESLDFGRAVVAPASPGPPALRVDYARRAFACLRHGISICDWVRSARAEVPLAPSGTRVYQSWPACTSEVQHSGQRPTGGRRRDLWSSLGVACPKTIDPGLLSGTGLPNR